MRVSFSVDGPPRRKERPRILKNGRSFTPKSTVQAEKLIRDCYILAAKGQRPATGPVKLSVIAVFAIPPSWPKHTREAAQAAKVWHVARGAPDLDNMVKLVSDALNGHAFVDDAQVAVITAGKRYGHPERIDVVVETLETLDVPATPGQQRLEQRISENRMGAKQRLLANPSKSKIKTPDTALGRAVAKAIERDDAERAQRKLL